MCHQSFRCYLGGKNLMKWASWKTHCRFPKKEGEALPYSHINIPGISDKLAFPSSMTVFCLLHWTWSTKHWLHIIFPGYPWWSANVPLTLHLFFFVPSEMHTAWVSIDGGLNDSLGEAKGRPQAFTYFSLTMFYLIQSYLIFFHIVYNKHWEADVPTNWKAVV